MSNISPSYMPSKDQFQIKYGSSVLSEFVRSHDYCCLIDELLQNDYDAESPYSIIQFLEDRLISTGFGNPIDEDGWKRLEMVLGTDEDVPPKQGLLGVKNQGLRSLFLIGDLIKISSNGFYTMLSSRYGALREKVVDSSTKNVKGTNIEILYRSKETKGLPVFTVEKEKELINDLEESLPLRIGMLSTLERPLFMKKIILMSVRTNTILIGRQNSKDISFVQNVSSLKRTLSLEIKRDKLQWY